MRKKRWICAACTLLAVPVFALAGCAEDAPPDESTPTAASVASTVSTVVPSEPEKKPEAGPFTAADGSFSVVVPQGFVEQVSDEASGTTMWMNPQTQMVLVATSVQQGGLQADELTKEAMQQTLSATYEQAEMNRFEQKKKDTGDLFVYDAKVTQNGKDSYLIQALYADEDQTITLVMTVLEDKQVEAGWSMIQTMTESLKAL